ncbi:MAG TPA: hypothetical protein PKA06_16910, partial [Gemmatales bacterium]|nr:hypothetical protein [Gemmatales bacterium]
AVKGMYRTSAFDETLAIGVAGVGEKNAIQYAFRPHEARPVTKLVDGQRYQVQVTARSEENTTGSMNVQTMNDWQMITSVPMNTSKDRWQTFTLDFIKPAGKDIQITVAPNAANGKYLWIKSLTFEALEGGSTSATNNSNPPRDQSSTAGNNTPRTDTPPPATSFPLRGTLYTLDLKKEVLFSITKQGDDVVEGDGGMMQWWPVCEKGTKARFSVKELGAGRVFGMERLEGNGYIVFVLNLEDLLRNVPKGTSLQVEIEYTTQKEGQGELKMQHGVNYSTLISENLESSDERWTHVSMFYEHNPAEKPQLAFTTNRGGVYVKNLSLRVE